MMSGMVMETIVEQHEAELDALRSVIAAKEKTINDLNDYIKQLETGIRECASDGGCRASKHLNHQTT